MGLIDRISRRRDPDPEVTDVGPGGGDVRIVGPARRGTGDVGGSDDTGEIERDGLDSTPGGSFLDELSSAFGDHDSDPALTSRVPVTTPRPAAPTTQSVDTVRIGSDGDGPDGDGPESDGPESDGPHGDGPDGDGRERLDVGRSTTTIAIGGDDDLPDAVYLDDAAGLDGEGTVFIDDDGQGDAILPQDATGHGIEPRLRQRRIGIRRAEGRRRLKRAALVGVVLAVVVGVLALLGSSLFAVSDVSVSGQRYADDATVAAVVEDLDGTPTLLVDVGDAERRLEEIPWVESARVRTDFPDSVSIELREREPLATVRGLDGRYRVLDREGRVLAVLDGQPVAPALISGPGTVDLEPGQFTDVGYAAAATLVTKLTPEVRSRLVSISATADGADIRLILSNEMLDGSEAPDIEVRLGAAVGDNEQLERLVRLQLVLDELLGTSTTVIDVSTEEATER